MAGVQSKTTKPAKKPAAAKKPAQPKKAAQPKKTAEPKKSTKKRAAAKSDSDDDEDQPKPKRGKKDGTAPKLYNSQSNGFYRAFAAAVDEGLLDVRRGPTAVDLAGAIYSRPNFTEDSFPPALKAKWEQFCKANADVALTLRRSVAQMRVLGPVDEDEESDDKSEKVKGMLRVIPLGVKLFDNDIFSKTLLFPGALVSVQKRKADLAAGVKDLFGDVKLNFPADVTTFKRPGSAYTVVEQMDSDTEEPAKSAALPEVTVVKRAKKTPAKGAATKKSPTKKMLASVSNISDEGSASDSEAIPNVKPTDADAIKDKEAVVGEQTVVDKILAEAERAKKNGKPWCGSEYVQDDSEDQGDDDGSQRDADEDQRDADEDKRDADKDLFGDAEYQGNDEEKDSMNQEVKIENGGDAGDAQPENEVVASVEDQEVVASIEDQEDEAGREVC